MNLKEALLQEENRLLEIQRTVNKRLKKAPEGLLRVASSKVQRQYMLYSRDKNGVLTKRYIRMGEVNLLSSLGQRDYDKKIKKLVDKRLADISRLTVSYENDEIEQIYENMCDSRKLLVTPVEPTKQQIYEQWRKEEYTGKDFYDDTPEIFTKKGERVRSKSEKIIADLLYDAGIEYKYECPLALKGFGTIYPDFTILHPVTLEEVYWEHCGMMSNDEYVATAVKKIECYMKNGYYPGKRLILTFESGENVLNNRIIEDMIHDFFEI